jgi:hypothetical protein
MLAGIDGDEEAIVADVLTRAAGLPATVGK